MTALRLVAGDPERDRLVVGRVTLAIGNEELPLELVVPDGERTLDEVMPVLQGLASLIAVRGTAAAEAEGRTISCRAGCGACCRQLVPISQAEARALARLVAAMPEPRQGDIRRRFAMALQRLDELGTIAEIEAARGGEVHGDLGELGIRYFRAGVACPFLDAEACSIHADRPLSCRQYLVTSPAENCTTPTPQNIATVKLPCTPSRALLQADTEASGIPWMPLVQALAYAGQAPEPPRAAAAELLRDVFSRL